METKLQDTGKESLIEVVLKSIDKLAKERV